MRKDNTLFIGKVALRFGTLSSTNQYATDLLAKTEPAEGTVIMADDQTRGRGQIGSSWDSRKGLNLLLSFILYPRFLTPSRQFRLSQAVALAVADTVARYLERAVKVKWPNDIYTGDRKLAGILIQNILGSGNIRASVTGIGLNVNQREFPAELPNPTSLALETARDHDRDDLFRHLCLDLERRYLQLRAGKGDVLDSDYLDKMYGYGLWGDFSLPDGSKFRGRIAGVEPDGHLRVERKGGWEEHFRPKEIIYPDSFEKKE